MITLRRDACLHKHAIALCGPRTVYTDEMAGEQRTEGQKKKQLRRHWDHRGINRRLGQVTADTRVFPEAVVPQCLVSAAQTIALDALGPQHAGSHASRVAVIADDQDMLAA